MELNNEITINVKAKLSVDNTTFKTCMDLINLRGVCDGYAGMIVRFDENIGPGIVWLQTEDELHTAMYGPKEDCCGI